MRLSPPRYIFSLAWIIFVLDFLTKSWAISFLAGHSDIHLIGSFLTLTFVKNSGAAFGIATGATILLSLFAIGVGATILRYAAMVNSRGWIVVMGLVLGGIMGNLTDRIFRSPGFLRGHVIDWIAIPHWPVFNIADSAIFIATGIAMILTFRNIPPLGVKKGGAKPTEKGGR